MEIIINHSLLSDAPYSEENKELFSFSHIATYDLIEDIKLGSPTCYLISGYRSAGKSSFIKQIESKIKATQEEKNNKNNKEESTTVSEIVFVYTNFSKYQNQTYLLRKLIRGLYLQLQGLASFKKIKSDELSLPINNQKAHLLEELYDKTFYDTSHSNNYTEKKETLTVLDIDVVQLSYFLLSILLFLFFFLSLIYHFVKIESIFKILGLTLSFISSIKVFFTIKQSINKNSTEQSDFNRKSLYDDEIADFHFFNILLSLQNNYKVVFVLDELDKVDDKEMDNLLKEMKPYLVSGLASFIAVAGQNLFYKYAKSKLEDDALLSSIFSKSIHIPLFAREELQNLFIQKLAKDNIQFTPDQIQFRNNYIDYLIFESKRIPRKFITLIRQSMTWNQGKAVIVLDEQVDNYEIFTQVNNIIDKIDDREIASQGFDFALRDYFVMQLFLKSNEILFTKKQSFSFEEILNSNE